MKLPEMIAGLRQRDYERYLCVLFEPAAAQPRLWAVLALHDALCNAADMATEPLAAALRLKWWQEAISSGDSTSHPLLPILKVQGIGSDVAEALITPRMMEIEQRKGFASLQAFEAYLQASGGKLHQILLGENTVLAEEAGAFYALVMSLRAMPQQLQRGIVRQPLDVLQRYAISPAAIEQGFEKEAFAHLMNYWMQEIKLRARALHGRIPPSRLSQRLHCTALLYARALARAGGNPASMPQRLNALALRLSACRLCGEPKLL